MKRTYQKPIAEKIAFKYDEQVAASSETLLCFFTVWQGPAGTNVCTNPQDWHGDPLYLV